MSSLKLQEFIDGYKTIEIELGNKGAWTFREPLMKWMTKPMSEVLRLMLLDGDYDTFMKIYTTELTPSSQKDLLNNIFERLGLPLGTLTKTEHMQRPL